MRPALYWMDWATAGLVLLLGGFAFLFRDALDEEAAVAVSLAVYPLLLIVVMRIIRFAGYVDDYTFRQWFDHDLGIIGYRAVYRMMRAIQMFFTRPSLVGAMAFFLCLGLSAWGMVRIAVALDSWVDGVLLFGSAMCFGLMIWPLIVRRERQSWPDI